MFKQCVASEKIHGTSAHIAYRKDQDKLLFFSGGSNHDLFLSIFNQEDLLNKFKENANQHLDVNKVAIFGESYGGCFAYKTPILLQNGKTEYLGKIVNNRLPLIVATYNFKDQRIEYKKIINWFKTKATYDDWITPFFKKRKRGGKSTKLVTTKNHIFFKKSAWGIEEIRAENLKSGDIVFLPSEKLSYIQEQLILGSLLGDGIIRDNYFSCVHSKKQKDYFYLKLRILNSLINDVSERISGFGADCLYLRTKSIPYFKNLKSILYPANKQTVSIDYIKKLHPIGLAFWYMDDGTLKKNNIGSHRDVCELCTDSFDEKDVNAIIEYFNSTGFSCYKFFCRGFPRIRFTPDGTIALHSVISSYIPHSMRYKIISTYADNYCFWDKFNEFAHDPLSLIETEVDYIKKGYDHKYQTNSEIATKYDIETEDNHNYFANNILVHNSIQAMAHTYGPNLKFVVFEVLIVYTNEQQEWLDPFQAERFAINFGLDFVPYSVIDTTEEAINNEMMRESVQAVKNGMGSGHMREGIVLRPLVEVIHQNGGRIICKHKRPEFAERKNTPRFDDPEELKILENAKAIAEEWVVPQRLLHVLDAFPEPSLQDAEKVIKAMIADVCSEANGEIVVTKETRRAIGKKTMQLFKKHLEQNSFT